MSRVYQPSGRVSPMGLSLALGVCVIGASTLGFAYSYGLVNFDHEELNLAIFVFYLFFIFLTVEKAVLWGKLRNRTLGILVGLATGLVGYYVSWVAFIHATSGELIVIENPLGLLELMRLLAQDGVWEVHGLRPTGVLLYLWWAGEAALMLAAPMWSGHLHTTQRAFCEGCDHWLTLDRPLGFFDFEGDSAELKRGLEQERSDALAGVRPHSGNFGNYLRARKECCEQCRRTHLLTLYRIVTKVDGHGGETVANETICERLKVASEVMDKLVAMAKAASPPCQELDDPNEEMADSPTAAET